MTEQLQPRIDKNTRLHWNGNHLVSIDLETTGTIAGYHEIWQIACIPLDSQIKPRKDVQPLFFEIRPDMLERVDEEHLTKLRKNAKFKRACSSGLDPEKAKDLFVHWNNKLNIGCNKYGTPYRIIALGHNYVNFDKLFLRHWLDDLYDEYFHYHCRDTMMTALFMNDRAAMHNEPVPFPKVDLSYLNQCYKLPPFEAHDALEDAKVTAEIYRLQTLKGLW